MKNNTDTKKKFALNKAFNCLILTGIILFLFGFALIKWNETGFGFCFSFFGLFLFIVPLILVPCAYSFDSQGISIHYIFFQKERYLWKNIRTIKINKDYSYYHYPILSLLVYGELKINGRIDGKERFYMQGIICRSLRTKKLLKKYWNGKITKS